jgi:prepilin-type processing-associated H-X9-DG protein
VAIFVTCACGGKFQTAEKNVGRSALCPDCGAALVIPQARPTAERAEPAEVDAIGFPTSDRARASLVLGLLSLLCAALTGIPAIALGWLGLEDIKNSRGRVRGRRAAISGIALGVFGSTVVSFAMLLPVFLAARGWVREKECTENVKRIALAMHNFVSQHRTFPPAAITDQEGQPLLSWRVAILPYLGPEEAKLYREFRRNEPWDSPHNRRLLDRMPAVYACPEEPEGKTTTNYLVVVGPGRLFTGKRKGVRLEEVSAGTSNTLMMTEADRAVPWTAPEEISGTPSEEGQGPEMGSRHPSGYHFAMADGSVRYAGGGGNVRAAATAANSPGRMNRASSTRVGLTGQK